MNWDGFFEGLDKAVKVVGEAALVKSARETISAWSQLDPADMEEDIKSDVFSMSGDELRRVDSNFRQLLKVKAFDVTFDNLLTAYAHFHGAWSLRLYLSSKRG